MCIILCNKIAMDCGVDKDKDEIYKYYCKMTEVREKESVQ